MFTILSSLSGLRSSCRIVCQFTYQNVVQPHAPVGGDGACNIRGFDSGVALDSGLLGCHAMSLGESRGVSRNPNAVFVGAKQPKKNLWDF
jgi:hypothetical protein